jgi:hypothetical protein
MATTTNFGWETPDDTDLVKDGALAMRTLGNAIDASLVDLKGGTTGQVLSKTSNTDMDFTWVTSDDANAIQNAIVDAKGDLITATAADTPARLAVGANGLVLTADSAESTGLKWSGGWTTWTPTITNLTLGNGTLTARYQKVANTIHFQFRILFGSTTSVGGDTRFTVPENHDGNFFGNLYSIAWDDSAGKAYPMAAFSFSSADIYLRAIETNATYAGSQALSSTIPFTWATSDILSCSGFYEV